MAFSKFTKGAVNNVLGGSKGSLTKSITGFKDWGSITKNLGLLNNLGGGKSGGGFMDAVSNIFGGGGSGSGGTGGDGSIWGALLSGLGGAAQAWMDEDMVKEAGKEQRKTRAFEAELLDYYKQKDIYRNRKALDAYGQFSLLGKYAPGYGGDPAVEVPNKPSA